MMENSISFFGPFDVNLSSQVLSNFQNSKNDIEPFQKEINETEEQLILQACSLPREQRLLVEKQIKEMAKSLIDTIFKMRQEKHSTEMISLAAKKGINEIHLASQNFFQGYQAYGLNKKASLLKMNNLALKIDTFGKNQFSTFRPPENFLPKDFLLDFMKSSQPASTQAQPLFEKVQKQNEEEKNTLKIFEERKKELARCIQMTDPEVAGPIGCLEKFSQGLTEEQQQDLRSFLPKAYTGKAVNEFFVPFAVLSKSIKTIVKTYYLSTLSDACLDARPMNHEACVAQLRDALEGRNPEFSKEIKEAMPRWVLKAFDLLAKGDEQLEKFDQYMASEYQTIPGLIHEGCEGLIDVSLTGASGAAFKLSKGVVRRAGKGITSTAREGEKVIKQADLFKKETFVSFIKEDAGSIKLPLEREYFIKKFLDIRYQITNGGKGTHLKLTRPESPMVIIPKDKELSPGTAKQLVRIFEVAENMDKAKQRALFQPEKVKTIEKLSYERPLPHRIDYSQNYLNDKKEFLKPKEFNGALSKDLLVVQYHNAESLSEFRTHKWFIPICEGNKHCTVEGIQDAVAKLSSWGEITHVTIAKIPAGEPVKFLHGRAMEQVSSISNEIRPGGGVQYRFFDFDPQWIMETRELP